MKYHLKMATHLTDLLENRFKFLGLHFGLDPIIGLVPGFGDLIALLLSVYLVWIGVQLRMPQEKLVIMITNCAFDFLVGLLPVLGDAGDFVFKANSRNLQLIQEHYSSLQLRPKIS